MSDPVLNITEINDLLADALIELHPPEIVSSFTNEGCVTFRQTLPSYHTDDDILVVYTIAPGYVPKSNDWVGLYSAEWKKPADFRTFMWAPVKAHDPKSPRLMRLLFKAVQLKFESDVSSQYQFVYLSRSNNILGASSTFFINQLSDEILHVGPSSEISLQISTSTPNTGGSDQFESVPMIEEALVQGPSDWVCMAIKHHASNTEGEPCTDVMPYIGNTPLHEAYAKQFPLPEQQPAQLEVSELCENLLNIGNQCAIVPVPRPITRGILVATTIKPQTKPETAPVPPKEEPPAVRPPVSMTIAKRRKRPCRACFRKRSKLRMIQKELVQLHEQVKGLKYDAEISDEKLTIKDMLLEELGSKVRNLLRENDTLTATNEHLAIDGSSCHQDLKELREILENTKQDGEKLKEELGASQTSVADLSVQLQDVYTILNMRGIILTMDNNGNIDVSKEGKCKRENTTDWTVTTSKRTERLLMTVAQQDDLISSLQTKCEQFAETETKTAEQEAALTAHLTVMEQEAQQAKQLAKDKDSRLEELGEEMKTQDNKINFLLQDAREREALIKELKTKFISAQDTRAGLENSVAHFIAEQNTLKDQLSASRKMIQEERRCNTELRLQHDVARMQHQEQITSLQDALKANALVKKGREASQWKMGWDVSKLITEFCSSVKMLCEQCGQPLRAVSPDALCNATSQTQSDVKSQQQQTIIHDITSQSTQASQSMKQAASQTLPKKSKHGSPKEPRAKAGVTNQKRALATQKAEDPEEPQIFDTGAHGSWSTSPTLRLEDETSATTSWADMCDNETSDLIHGFSFLAAQTEDTSPIYTQTEDTSPIYTQPEDTSPIYTEPERRPAPSKKRKARKYQFQTYRHHSSRGRGPPSHSPRIFQPPQNTPPEE